MSDCRHRRRVMRKQLFLQHASLFPGITELHSVPPSRSSSLWPMPQTSRPRDSIQSETSRPRDSIQSETSRPRDSIQSETSRPRDSIQSETSRPRDSSQSETSRPRDSIQSEVNMALDGILTLSSGSTRRQDQVGECGARRYTGSGRRHGRPVTDRQTIEIARPLPQVPRRRSHRKHDHRLSASSKTHRSRSNTLKMKEVRTSIYETLRSLRHREKHGHCVAPPSIGRGTTGIEQLRGSSSISPPDSNIHDLNAANVTAWTLDHFPWTSNENVRQTSNISSERVASSPRVHDIHRQTSVNCRTVDLPPAVVGITGHSMYTNKNPPFRVINIGDHTNSNETAPPSVTDITRQASANSSMRVAPEKPFSDITYGLFPLPPSPELLLNLQEKSTLPLGCTLPLGRTLLAGRTLPDRQMASQLLLRPSPGCQHTRTWKSFSGLFPDEHDTTIHQLLHHQEHHSGNVNVVIVSNISIMAVLQMTWWSLPLV